MRYREHKKALSHKHKKRILQSYPLIYVETWEPLAPIIIHTSYHLVDYSCALLRHFGAQQIHVDLPWRILTTLLPPSSHWPQDSVELMNLVRMFLYHFIM